MKNRKLFISLFLLVSLLFLGVGYAALTNTLNIGGSISATKNDKNLKVEFTESVLHAQDALGNEDTTFLVESTYSGQSATVTIQNMSTLGQTAVIEFKVSNNSENLASLTATLDTADISVNLGLEGVALDAGKDSNAASNIFEGDHFDVSAEFFTKTEANIGSITDGVATITSGQHVYIRVTVELVEIVSSSTFPTHDIIISFVAETED